MTSRTVGTMTKKTAIVTGGSRGMGRNTAANLAKRGVDVIFTYHSNQPEAESLMREIEATGGKAAGFRLDTGELRAFDGFVADVHKTLESWGRERFDYLVNNAGNSQHIDFDKVTEADFDAVVNVHFKGVYFLTQKLLPLINDGGRIVNISSGLTRVSGPAALLMPPPRERLKFSRAISQKSWGRAGSPPTWWRRAQSRPTSAAAWCGTIPKSTKRSRP